MRVSRIILCAGVALLFASWTGPASGGPIRQQKARVFHPHVNLLHPFAEPKVKFDKPILRSPSLSDPTVFPLVRKMLIAQNRLALEGTMVTKTALGTFVQHALLNGAHAQRYECESPAANRGEVIIDNGHLRYHIYPGGKVVTLPSAVKQRQVRIPFVMREIRQGNLIVQRMGTGLVAGHSCVIVRIIPPYAADWYQYWIDPSNGAQLQIEQYDASGKQISATYFTQVNYHPQLNSHLFDPPPSSGAVSPPAGFPVSSAPSLPTVAQAGFAARQPVFLPDGFHFQSAEVTQHKQKKLVKLTYGNGLNALSLFETPVTGKLGPNAAKIHSPRPGVVITKRDGLVMILIGSLGKKVLARILNSIQ